jgi:hypothetical protein
MKTLPSILLAAICGMSTTTAAEWTDLFNGKDLDAWIKRGGNASYKVEDGAIVGTSTLNTANTFLCTPRDYADFILEYEFKVDPKLNSGVQIRSQAFAEPITIEWSGKTIKVPANRVHGYQIEIDPEPAKDRWWSAGIYEEGARGWLYPGQLGGNPKDFTAQGRKIFKQEDWNKVRVEAIGDSIRTTLNGVPCAAITDKRVASGFIGLQVHGIGKDASKDGTEVRWRNLRIQELAAITTTAGSSSAANTLTEAEKAAGWRLLWDGRTGDGWRSAAAPEFPKSGWEIQHGTLIVQKGGGDLVTRETFGDFELQLEFKLTPGANSGVKVFVGKNPGKDSVSSLGPEFQILDDDRHPDAKMGKNGSRTIGSLYDVIPAPADKKVRPIGEWNHGRILARGKSLTFWLNGEKTVEVERGSPAWQEMVKTSKFKNNKGFGELAEGHILLQDHGDKVFFRNLKIRTAPDQ